MLRTFSRAGSGARFAGGIPTLARAGRPEQRIGPARARAHRHARAPGAANAGELARMEYGFLYDKARQLLAIGYNVAEHRRDASYYDLLASEARFDQLRGDRAGAAAAGELVRARPPAHDRRRRAGAAVVERLDVRVPDAAAGDADVREHAARPDLPRGGGAADRLRQPARRAVGHLGIAATTRSTRPSTTSTAPSACRASA